MVKFDSDLVHHSHAMIIGGVDGSGFMLNWAFGCEFLQAATTTGIERSLKLSYSE